MKNTTQKIVTALGIIFYCGLTFSQKINPNGYNIFYYENDTISSKGNLKNGKPEGYWKNYNRDGSIKSEGNRKNHLLDSTWIFYENRFKKEEVKYNKNKKDGKFIEYSDSGRLYSKSNYVNDTLQGERILYYNTGELHFRYNYQDGNYQGKAYEYSKDGKIISVFEYNKGKLIRREKINRYNENNEKTGLWKEFSPNGTLREEGEYKNGKKNGIFREYKYNGELKDLKRYDMDKVNIDDDDLQFVQFFKEYYPTGELHFTIAKNDFGKRQGITQEYDKKGNIIETVIYKNDTIIAKGIIDKDGLKQKEWNFYNKGNEVIATGNYKDDFKIGNWEYFYLSGKTEQTGKYKKGKQEGRWKWLYPSGAIHRDEYYRRGKEDGEITEYDELGNVLTRGNYINGLRNGEWFYQVGDHTEKGEYIEGKKEGNWIHYYMTKQLYFKGKYKNGRPIEKHIYYHVNGKKKWTGIYSLGKKEGKWIRYNNLGETLVTYTYSNDILIKTDGKKIKPPFNKEIN